MLAPPFSGSEIAAMFTTNYVSEEVGSLVGRLTGLCGKTWTLAAAVNSSFGSDRSLHP